jgi:hypothetical protein
MIIIIIIIIIIIPNRHDQDMIGSLLTPITVCVCVGAPTAPSESHDPFQTRNQTEGADHRLTSKHQRNTL